VQRWTARRTGWIVLAAAAMLAAAAPASTQQSFTAVYDSSRPIRLQGPVTRIDWVNPHAFLFIDVRDPAGTTVNWAVEFGNPIDLERDGWKPGALHIGDVVSVDAIVARGEKRQAFARSVVLKGTGKTLFAPGPRRPAPAHEPAPRWPDGQVRLGPPAGRKGYWGAASVKSFVEAGVTVAMNDDGLLANLADADKVAPFKPWAKALYEHRQRTFLADDPIARCLPPGLPRQFHMPNGFQFVEQKELGRILVLLGGGDRNWRIIYTDGRPSAQPAEVVLGYYGTSVGRWQGDTLVVDSVGFNERFWLTSGGLPHTEGLHLVERFSRPTLGTLKYDVTVDDPRTYTRTWTGGWTLQWVPDRDIEEYFCEENAESTFVR
jgi:uncharacterized protein DUF6152